jgi:transposase
MQKLHYVGLDVHARTIAIAVADGHAVRSLGTIDHDVPKLRKVVQKIGPVSDLHIVYEAGPTGYGLCRALRDADYGCEVIAPSLIPTMPGDRVKTDRRDAKKLAMLAQAGLLTPVYVPEVDQEALRDLVRAREAAKESQKKASQQLDKFLLRHGRRPGEKMTKWTMKHMAWVRSQRFAQTAQQTAFEEYLAEFEHQCERVKRFDGHLLAASDQLQPGQQAMVSALVALKGVRFLTAVTVVSEIGDMMRFSHPTQLMAYAGVVPREHSSGDAVRRGAITKRVTCWAPRGLS